MKVGFTIRYMDRQKWRAVNSRVIGSLRGKVTWTKAFDHLRYELGRIDARDVVIETGYKPNQLRNDGWPYADAKPEHGQVRVSFKRDGVPMSFFFGGWTNTEYNVSMIARTLEALRAVDRYGCTQAGEQYRGWAKLPPGGGIVAAEWASVEDAARFLVEVEGIVSGADVDEAIEATVTDAQATYWNAAKKAHPDMGGSAELMAKVNRARDFIEKGGKS